MTIVYVDMVGDLFHVGHLNLIKKAREFGDYLIVGVHSDEDTASYKRKPIIEEGQRYNMISSCRYVDKVIEAAPLDITKDFIERNKINIIVHGDDLSKELKKQYKIPIELEMVKYIPYTKGISTTEIISKVKNKTNWEEIWQRKALEKPFDLRKINGWENTEISSAQTVQVIKERLKISSKDNVLEIGCGAGFLAEFFVNNNKEYTGDAHCPFFVNNIKEYTGADRSQNMINLAKSIFNCRFVNCEASNLPFWEEEFDYVIAYSIFQYFPSKEYAQEAISEMKRVAKKGIYIGDLPLESHEKNHLLYKREQFSDEWEISKGLYTDKRFDVYQKWDKGNE